MLPIRLLSLVLMVIFSMAWAQKPVAVATINPYGQLLRELVGDRFEVRVLVDPGQNPHMYEPRPSDVKRVSEARLVVQNGAGLDNWLTDKLLRANGLNVEVLEVAALVRPLRNAQGEPDPHVWTCPGRMRLLVPTLVRALVQHDPSGRAVYEIRGARLVKELERLEGAMKEAFSGQKKPLLLLRNPFTYLVEQHKLPVAQVIVPSPQASEANARALAQTKRTVEERGLRYLVAPLQAGDQARSTAANLGLEPLLLDLLGAESGGYVDTWKKNLELLQKALR